MVKPVGMARQDYDLELAGGRIPAGAALGSRAQDLQNCAVLVDVGVGERIIEDGDERLVLGENAAQRQAHKQA